MTTRDQFQNMFLKWNPRPPPRAKGPEPGAGSPVASADEVFSEDVGGAEDAVLGDPDEEAAVVGVFPVAAAWYSAKAVALALTAKT